jgi:hypothetical protein
VSSEPLPKHDRPDACRDDGDNGVNNATGRSGYGHRAGPAS